MHTQKYLRLIALCLGALTSVSACGAGDDDDANAAGSGGAAAPIAGSGGAAPVAGSGGAAAGASGSGGAAAGAGGTGSGGATAGAGGTGSGGTGSGGTGSGGTGSGGTGSMHPPIVPGSPTFGAVFEEIITGTGCNVGSLCHGGAVGKLKMSDRDTAYAALFNVAAMGTSFETTGCESTKLLRVKPGDPDASLLVQKVDPPAGGVPCGSAMPPTGELDPKFVQQIRTWIMNGALND